jgi:putative Mg2+ transporter-C (MgtC) family protein
MSDVGYLLRILLAAGLSAVIGIERESHGRPAGLRTHMMVGVGAALIVVAFQAVWGELVGDGSAIGLSTEVARLAAGVITGIGFLGAGTIIKQGDWVLGLTTAASLWFVAALGVASGLGAFWIALGSGAIGFAILSFVDPLASRIPSVTYQTLTLIAEEDRQGAVEAALRSCSVDLRLRATLVNWEWESATRRVTLTYRIRHRGQLGVQALAERLSGVEGVLETQVRL